MPKQLLLKFFKDKIFLRFLFVLSGHLSSLSKVISYNKILNAKQKFRSVLAGVLSYATLGGSSYIII